METFPIYSYIIKDESGHVYASYSAKSSKDALETFAHRSGMKDFEIIKISPSNAHYIRTDSLDGVIVAIRGNRINEL